LCAKIEKYGYNAVVTTEMRLRLCDRSRVCSCRPNQGIITEPGFD